jgi:hypothetical protein
MQRAIGVIVVAALAIGQAVFGVFRALGWFRIGSDLMGRGVLLLPMIGVFAYARGAFVFIIAALYVAFAWGAFSRKGWAWWLGLIVAAINALLVISAVIEGESVMRAAFWLIAPAVIVAYLLSAQGRQALKAR